MQIRKLPLEHWFGFTMLRSRALWVNDSNDTSHLYVQHQQSYLYAVKAWWMDKRTNQRMDICIPWTAFTAKNALFYRLYFWISYKACAQKQNGQSKEKSVLHGGWKLSGSLFLPVLAKVSIEVILNFVLKNKPDSNYGRIHIMFLVLMNFLFLFIIKFHLLPQNVYHQNFYNLNLGWASLRT